MTIVLLTLLAIALILVVAGLFLSPKAQAPKQPDVSFRTRNGTRVYRGESQKYQPSKSVRLQRSVTMDLDYPGYKPSRAQRSYPQKTYVQPRQYAHYEPAPEEGNWSRVFALINVKQLVYPRDGEPTPWLGVCLILLALFGIGLFSVQSLLLSHSNQALWLMNPGMATPAVTPQAQSKTSTQSTSTQPVFVGLSGASKALVRINQMATDQYSSTAEYNTWADAACSTATMTEVMNAYGHNYRVTDVLKVEAGLNQITPQLGLLSSNGIDVTVAKFGFQTAHLSNATLDQVIQIANQGRPVIISFPPDRVAGGHILIVRGGNGSQVYLADSSLLDQTVMTRAAFSSLWEGFAVVVTPKTN
jgi:hypothetical protein